MTYSKANTVLWAIVAFSALGIGACSARKTSLSDVTAGAPPPESSPGTIAVVPFALDDSLRDSDTNAVHDFESYYLAGRLADALRRSAWVKEVYVSPEWTPATDYVVRGTITQSDGEILTISVLPALLGREQDDSWATEVTIDFATSDFGNPSQDPLEPIVAEMVQVVIWDMESLQPSDRKAVEAARFAAYSGRNASEWSSDDSPLVEKGAEIERKKMLAPASMLISERVAGGKEAYEMWTFEATRLKEKERAADAKMMAGMLLGGLSAAGAGMGSSMAAVSSAQQSMDTATRIMTQAIDASSDAAISRSQMDFAFNDSFEPLSVEFEGTQRTLEGPWKQQVAQLRGFFRQVLNPGGPSADTGRSAANLASGGSPSDG